MTEFHAVDQTDNEIKVWAGPVIAAKTLRRAAEYVADHLPFLIIVGELVDSDLDIEIPDDIEYQFCEN